MSISSVLPNRGIVASGGSALVCAPGGPWKPLPHVSISSRRVSWRCRPLQRLAGRGSRISVCAAPSCQSVEVSASVLERIGFGGVEFGSKALQVVKEGLVFQQARSPELIRAAAYLRAVSFYTIPEGRSEDAIQVLLAFYVNVLQNVFQRIVDYSMFYFICHTAIFIKSPSRSALVMQVDSLLGADS